MLLVDSSVWVDHFARSNPLLITHLEANAVMTHPFVIGELAVGSLKSRALILQFLHDLPKAVIASHEEAEALIESHRLFGKGIGLVDLHLLASAALSHTKLWTFDKKLHQIAVGLGLAAMT